ncbi:MAG TPA: rRNA (guanine-N1)-methyltransferase, partial [Actinomycetaceae bacterium]|nr:rRNA (guanine-N1)-methyltransferase [Actinomycetaceae bacterium]
MDRPRIDLVLPHLRCPVCGGHLTRAERAVGCRAGHRYDLARQNYLTLLGGRAPAGPGDTADMVAAREAFLERGHYRPIATALAEAVSQV